VVMAARKRANILVNRPERPCGRLGTRTRCFNNKCAGTKLPSHGRGRLPLHLDQLSQEFRDSDLYVSEIERDCEVP
jgi:hypothetical protein